MKSNVCFHFIQNNLLEMKNALIFFQLLVSYKNIDYKFYKMLFSLYKFFVIKFSFSIIYMYIL